MSKISSLIESLIKDYSSQQRGFVQTHVPRVQVFWTREYLPREPLVYEPGIMILGQGHKIGYLGPREFVYDPDTCLVVGAPIPFECESYATPEEPLLGLRIDIDLALLHAIVTKMSGEFDFVEDLSGAYSAVEPSRMEPDLIAATERLLTCLQNPESSMILGEARVTEVIYQVLLGEKGKVLHGLTQQNTQYGCIANALAKIHKDYDQALCVEELARNSAMSTSAFHRAFKSVTGNSPMQYLKRIRLDKARGLLLHHNFQVNTAAYQVGYESPSQFSREFKRLFNVSPSELKAG